jgi:hypothetical protein
MVNHFEYPQPGAMYFSKLTQDKVSGKLTMTNTERVNDYKEGGTWFPCSGTITPWDSHLGRSDDKQSGHQATLRTAASIHDAQI